MIPTESHASQIQAEEYQLPITTGNYHTYLAQSASAALAEALGPYNQNAGGVETSPDQPLQCQVSPSVYPQVIECAVVQTPDGKQLRLKPHLDTSINSVTALTIAGTESQYVVIHLTDAHYNGAGACTEGLSSFIQSSLKSMLVNNPYADTNSPSELACRDAVDHPQILLNSPEEGPYSISVVPDPFGNNFILPAGANPQDLVIALAGYYQTTPEHFQYSQGILTIDELTSAFPAPPKEVIATATAEPTPGPDQSLVQAVIDHTIPPNQSRLHPSQVRTTILFDRKPGDPYPVYYSPSSATSPAFIQLTDTLDSNLPPSQKKLQKAVTEVQTGTTLRHPLRDWWHNLWSDLWHTPKIIPETASTKEPKALIGQYAILALLHEPYTNSLTVAGQLDGQSSPFVLIDPAKTIEPDDFYLTDAQGNIDYEGSNALFAWMSHIANHSEARLTVVGSACVGNPPATESQLINIAENCEPTVPTVPGYLIGPTGDLIPTEIPRGTRGEVTELFFRGLSGEIYAVLTANNYYDIPQNSRRGALDQDIKDQFSTVQSELQLIVNFEDLASTQ